MGGVGWGMLTSCSWYVDGWGGVGHVNVMLYTLMGGVGWGLTSCSWYVDGWGGVGHVNVMFMVRWWGGVGHVNVMFMVRWWVGWGGVGHVNVMFKTQALHITPRAAVKTVLFRWKKKEKESWHVLFRVGKQEKNIWKRTCCSRLMKLKQQRAKKRLTINMCRFMLTLKFAANTNKKRHLFILPHVPQ